VNFFITHAKFSFVEKLEKLGCMGLFQVRDEVYPQLARLVYANFENVDPRLRVEPTTPPKSKALSSLSLLPLLKEFSI